MKRNLSQARIRWSYSIISVVALAIALSSCARQSHRIATVDKSIAAATAPRLNINTASLAELEKLPGVGEVLAERIVSYRQQYGSFRRVEHLLMVRGFSDHKFRAVRDLVAAE